MTTLRSKPISFDVFAEEEYRDCVIYRALLSIETVPEFRKILQEIIKNQEDHYEFWKKLSSQKEFGISNAQVALYKSMRRVLGLTFTLRFLEAKEKYAIQEYESLLKVAPPEVKEKIRQIIKHETHHEKEFIGQIKEEKVEFISNIILGLNDGLIELTGALVGFSFAFNSQLTVALSGLITGTAASLSMASSAYMQARHEEGKDAKKAGIYTGISYIIVVALLVLPFFLLNSMMASLTTMIITVVIIITATAYYTAIIFERRFSKQFGEMFVFSIGVALVSFLIGSAFQRWLGTEA